jgi:putative DNA primase/helicase
MESIVSGILDGQGIIGYNSHSYITNIIKKLRCILIERKWAERSPKELLPFRNGVVEVATGKLLPHSPDYRLTWQLPREHNPLATNWNTIDAYLDHLCGGNAALKDIYLCFCNAVLTGRGDLQKFMHMIGIGGSGKGTFARLVTALIGEENILSTTLEDWCNSRFESANAYRKRLVVFWDEDKQVGNIGKFLSLTGGDWIRAEEKGKKGFQYRYDGMTLVMSNTPIFTGNAASRIKRRVITCPCNAVVSPLKVRDMEEEFKPELDALVNYVLSIPDSHVTACPTGIHRRTRMYLGVLGKPDEG